MKSTLKPYVFASIAVACSLASVACSDATNGGGFFTSQPDPPPSDVFEVAYVSGHLGSYYDCPQDALSPGAGEAPGPQAGRAACAEPGDCPQIDYMNCEHAEVTVRLVNTGTTTIVGLELTTVKLWLVGAENDAFTTEVVTVTREDGQLLGAAIAPGAEMNLNVVFKGMDPYGAAAKFSADGVNGAMKVELLFTTPDTDRTVITPELYMVPTIAT